MRVVVGGLCDKWNCDHDTFRASGGPVRVLVPGVPLARAEVGRC